MQLRLSGQKWLIGYLWARIARGWRSGCYRQSLRGEQNLFCHDLTRAMARELCAVNLATDSNFEFVKEGQVSERGELRTTGRDIGEGPLVLTPECYSTTMAMQSGCSLACVWIGIVNCEQTLLWPCCGRGIGPRYQILHLMR